MPPKDGSWCPTEFPVKTLEDLKIFRAVTERMRYVPSYERIREVLGEIGQQGVLDMVIPRSPFGKLVHELMGFEELIYAHHDEPESVLEWMEFQEHHDMGAHPTGGHRP